MGEAGESGVVVAGLLDSLLDTVLEQGVPPRKVATVHPFSLNSGGAGEQVGPAPLRLAGFAVDPSPRPTLKLANFAVDPALDPALVPASGTASTPTTPRLKLANFAVDPAGTEGGGAGWGAAAGPPPLTPRSAMEGGAPRQFRSPTLPTLTRAPSPHVSASPPAPVPTAACFGHFERELEYRYCLRSIGSSQAVSPGWVIFSSLDNVYIKLLVQEAGLAGLPRDPLAWQSVQVSVIALTLQNFNTIGTKKKRERQLAISLNINIMEESIDLLN